MSASQTAMHISNLRCLLKMQILDVTLKDWNWLGSDVEAKSALGVSKKSSADKGPTLKY